jgi:hypothetical protein
VEHCLGVRETDRARPIDGSVAAHSAIMAIAAYIPGGVTGCRPIRALGCVSGWQVVPCVVSKQVVERLHGVLIAVDMTYPDWV